MCPTNRAADQRKIADDIEHLVADKFVGITQRFGGEDGVVTNDHRIFKAATLNEAVFDEKLDLFEETKCSSVREFALPTFGRDFEAVKLSEARLFCRRSCM